MLLPDEAAFTLANITCWCKSTLWVFVKAVEVVVDLISVVVRIIECDICYTTGFDWWSDGRSNYICRRSSRENLHAYPKPSLAAVRRLHSKYFIFPYRVALIFCVNQGYTENFCVKALHQPQQEFG